MATHTCNQNCGCNNTYTVSAPCPPACPEVFNSQCIVYTGTDILCGQDTVIKRYDYLDTVITKLVNYICSGLANVPATVVESDSEFLTVTSVVVGNTTTWVLDLVNLPSQQIYVVEAGGTNVTVNENTVGNTTTFTVTAQGTDVQSGDNFIDVTSTQVGDDDIYTITLDINEVAQEIGEVSVAQGTSDNVFVTTVNNFPTPNDTQYRLDVVSTDVQSTDLLITVTPSGGTAPAYDQLFELALNEILLREFIMDTTSGAGAVTGIIAGIGIGVAYDPLLHALTITNTGTLPNIWYTVSDGASDINASSITSKLYIEGDAIIDGISTSLVSGPGPNEATFTIVNEDRGSDQLIFGTINCNNGGPTVGSCVASSNTDALTIVGGAEISVSVPALNTIVIDCDINSIYSNVAGDTGSAAAVTTTDTLEIIGVASSAITTAVTTAPGVTTLEIDWTGAVVDGLTITGDGTAGNPLIAPEQYLWLTLEGDTGSAINATTTTDALTIAGANGIVTNTTGTTLTITSPVNRDSSSVTAQVIALATPYNLTHTLGQQFVSLTIINTATQADVTGRFSIIYNGVGTYIIQENDGFTGTVRVLAIG